MENRVGALVGDPMMNRQAIAKAKIALQLRLRGFAGDECDDGVIGCGMPRPRP